MLNFRVVQNFDQHGRNNGHHIEVSGSISDLDAAELDGPSGCDDFAPYLHELEAIRGYILCTNLISSQTHLNLLEQIQDAQVAFNEVTSALRTARHQYETMQAFLEVQGIKSMENFPSLAVPKLTGELLQEKKSLNDYEL